MFALFVMTMSLLERSSARMSTLPRIMPRSASETAATRLAFGVLAGVSGFCCPRRLGRFSRRPGCCGGVLLPKPSPPDVFAPEVSFCVSFWDSVTIVSSAVLMSVATAYSIWRTNTSSVTGVATSRSLMISSIRLTFSCVSVTRIEFVRSNACSWPLGSLNPSMAFCASSVVMFTRRIIWLTTLPFSDRGLPGMFIRIGLPCVRSVLRWSARRNLSPNGSRTTPFIVSVTSMASMYSSFERSWPSSDLRVIVTFGRSGAGMIVFWHCSA